MLQRTFKLAGVPITQLTIFLGMAALFAVSMDERPIREVLRLRMLTLTGLVKSVFLGVLSWALAQVLGVILIGLITRAGGKVPETYQIFTNAPFWAALLTGGLVPAICEESAFRGYILWNLGPLGPRTAVIATGILFGAMHLSLIRVIPLATLGIIFATAVQRTGSILPGMIMHLTNNGIVLTLSFFFQRFAGESAGAGPMSAGSVAFLLTITVLLGLSVYGLSRTFGPEDLAAAPEVAPSAAAAGASADQQDGVTEEIQLDDIPGAAPRGGSRLLLALVPLLPAVMLYAWAAADEINRVFMAR